MKLPALDLLDAAAVLGLVLIGWGLWWIWQPLAPLIVGAIMLTGFCWVIQQGRSKQNGRTNKPD